MLDDWRRPVQQRTDSLVGFNPPQEWRCGPDTIWVRRHIRWFRISFKWGNAAMFFFLLQILRKSIDLRMRCVVCFNVSKELENSWIQNSSAVVRLKRSRWPILTCRLLLSFQGVGKNVNSLPVVWSKEDTLSKDTKRLNHRMTWSLYLTICWAQRSRYFPCQGLGILVSFIIQCHSINTQ